VFLAAIKRHRVAYAYIAPFSLLFIIFGLFPILSGFVLSLTNWDGVSAMRFIGIRHSARLLRDGMFWRAMANTLYIGFFSHIFILLGGLLLAYVLNAKMVRYKNIFKAIYFLPMVTSAVAAANIFQALFGLNSGLINFALQSIGLERIDWWGGNGSYIKVAVVIMFSWKWIGWNMVIYLAGMQGISEELYEAARIDGAGHRQLFFRNTVPLLKPIFLFTILQSTICTIILFSEPFVLTNSLKGGTGNQGLTAMMYLLDKAPYGNNLYGFASAFAYVLCAMIVCVSLINMKLCESDEHAKGAR